MEARNCPGCGKAFYSYGKSIVCPECEKKDEEMFQSVRTYLKDYPGASMSQVSKATEVSVKRITRYLREGRLEVSDGMGDFLKCVKCGTGIKTGKYCPKCASKLSNKLQSSIKTEPAPLILDDKKKKARMHTNNLRQ